MSRPDRFWQRWSEGEQPVDEEGPDPRRAWRRHFTSFFGVAPEKHWLFSGRRFKPWATGRLGEPAAFNPLVAVVLSRGGGLLSLYVLHLLSERPRYGNDVMREIQERTGGAWGANPGAVYPLLTALERRGLIEGDWEDPDKRTRRIYRLQPDGRRELQRLKEVLRPKLEQAIDVLHDLNRDLQEE
jgi:DNA-binding PadR family transcriptional regulator